MIDSDICEICKVKFSLKWMVVWADELDKTHMLCAPCLLELDHYKASVFSQGDLTDEELEEF